MQRSIPRSALLILTLLAGAWLAACDLRPDTVTREHYDQLELGMSYGEVAAILGEPADRHPRLGVEQFTWVADGGERQIHAKFAFDRAIYYSSKGLAPVAAGRH